MRNRKQFLDEAIALAPTGVVSLLTDGPVARPGYVADNMPLSEKQAAETLQQVIDMRRGVDLLLARKDVDPKRLAYVGHSYNASIGAILSGVDRRFKAFVLMAGTMSDEVHMKRGAFDNLAPHSLNAEARRDRIAFLTEQLKLKTLPAKVIDSIPALYQPPRPN